MIFVPAIFLSLLLAGNLFAEDIELPAEQKEEIIVEPQPNSILLSRTPQTEQDKALVTLYDNGFYFSGPGSTLKIGGWAQIDYRDFIGKHPRKDTFLIRRAQVDFRGLLAEDFAYALYIRALRDQASLREAWLEYRKFPAATVRIGLFKLPFSLEASYSARWIYFVERSLAATNLAPFYDIGIQLYGRIFCERVIYAVAWFNERDNDNFQTEDGKGIVGRFTYQPFRYLCHSPFRRLYIGGSVLFSDVDELIDHIHYRTAARTPFVTFNKGDFEDGNEYRAGFEAQWLNGPFVANTE